MNFKLQPPPQKKLPCRVLALKVLLSSLVCFICCNTLNLCSLVPLDRTVFTSLIGNKNKCGATLPSWALKEKLEEAWKMMNWRASRHQRMHIYFYLKAPWDCAFGGGAPVSVSQLSSFSILCRRLLWTATVTRRAMIVTCGRGEGNYLQILGEKQLWKRSAGLNCRRIAPLTHQLCWVGVPLGLKVKCTSRLHWRFKSRAVVCFSFFQFLYGIYSTFCPEVIAYGISIYFKHYTQKCPIGIIGITHKPSTQYIKIHLTVLLSQRSENWRDLWQVESLNLFFFFAGGAFMHFLYPRLGATSWFAVLKHSLWHI